MRSALVRKMFSLVAVPALTLSFAACEDSTGPGLPRGVEIRPVTTVFPIEVVNGRKRVVVTTLIENDSERTIYYEYCSEGISQRMEVWRSIWRPVCAAILVPPEPIEPGQSKLVSMNIIDQPDVPQIRFPFENLNASYRVDVRLLMRSRVPGSDKLVLIDLDQSSSKAFGVTQ